jgi:hypothetical protein
VKGVRLGRIAAVVVVGAIAALLGAARAGAAGGVTY